jgi:quinohemoprotein ethanol dehydrogenase
VPFSPPPAFASPIDPPEFKVNEELATQGLKIYAQSCMLCHGGGVVAGGMAPDLRESLIPLSEESFSEVVIRGALVANGMPRFRDFTGEHVSALSHYIRNMARKTLAEQ